MNNDEKKPIRPWKDVAAEASKETDSAKLIELIHELTEAMDAEKRPKPEVPQKAAS